MSSPIVLPTPATHQEWLEQRRDGVGSSDASAILGLSTYESPYSLWQQKTGKVPLDPPVDDTTAELREWGHRLEPVIRQATAERLGLVIEKPDHAFAHPGRVWQRCNVDGWTEDNRIAEFKTTNERNRRYWLMGVPDHAYVQVHHASLVTGAKEAVVAALVGGQKLIVHEFEMNKNVLEILFEAEETFWGHVTSDTPPPLDGHQRTLEALNAAWTPKGGAKEIDQQSVEDVWGEYQAAHTAEKEAKKQKDYAKSRLLALMEGHERLVTGDLTWAAMQGGQLNEAALLESHPEEASPFLRDIKKLDRDAFRAAHPDLFTKFQGRTLSVKGEL